VIKPQTAEGISQSIFKFSTVGMIQMNLI